MRARELFTALCVALAIALTATWPLATDMTGSLPHDPRFSPFAGSDMNIWVWNFWWARVVAESGASPFTCDLIFTPYGHSLAFHTHTFLWGLASLPLQWMGGLFFGVNAMILLLLSVSSTAAYVLARELELRPLAAGLVGFAWGFSPYFMQKGLVHLNLFASPWLPLGLLFLLRWLNRRPNERIWVHGLGLGLVAGLCLLTGSLQTVYLAASCLVLAIIRPSRGADDEPSRENLIKLQPVLVALLAFSLTAMPFLSEWYAERQSNGAYGAFPQEFHPQFSDFLTPSGLHPLFAGLGGAEALVDAPFAGRRPEHAGLYLRLSLLALGVIGALRAATARRWMIGFAFMFLLTWDPGPEPEGWLSSIYRSVPVIDLLRVPARFFPSALLFLCVAAGFGLQALAETSRQRLAAGLLIVVLIFESWTGTYPSVPIEIPAAVERIAAGPSEGAVLSLPYVPGATESMLWQTHHGHGVPVSYVARTQPDRLELLSRATPDLFSLSLGIAMPSPAALAHDLRNARIRHILFRGLGGEDANPLFELLDEMDGWERSEDLGDGVDWWYRTTP